jgi:hypothetical protein
MIHDIFKKEFRVKARKNLSENYCHWTDEMEEKEIIRLISISICEITLTH